MNIFVLMDKSFIQSIINNIIMVNQRMTSLYKSRLRIKFRGNFVQIQKENNKIK